MKYICENCGWCDDLEEFFWQGRDIDDFGWNCPVCGKDDGWIHEAVMCDVCGDWFGEDELEGGICRNCLWNYITVQRPDIVLGFLYENRDVFGEYASEIICRESKKKTARCSQHQTVAMKGELK